MSVITSAIYERLAGDYELTGMLAVYKGQPAIFTIGSAPGEANTPFIVTAGEVSQLPFDTKTSRGRELIRDVRCYDRASGSVVTIEAVAERVRYLLHRQPLAIDGFDWVISNCVGPVVADEVDYYGRILTLSLKAQEE
jgi:hypothetical protein